MMLSAGVTMCSTYFELVYFLISYVCLDGLR